MAVLGQRGLPRYWVAALLLMLAQSQMTLVDGADPDVNMSQMSLEDGADPDVNMSQMSLEDSADPDVNMEDVDGAFPAYVTFLSCFGAAVLCGSCFALCFGRVGRVRYDGTPGPEVCVCAVPAGCALAAGFIALFIWVDKMLPVWKARHEDMANLDHAFELYVSSIAFLGLFGISSCFTLFLRFEIPFDDHDEDVVWISLGVSGFFGIITLVLGCSWLLIMCPVWGSRDEEMAGVDHAYELYVFSFVFLSLFCISSIATGLLFKRDGVMYKVGFIASAVLLLITFALGGSWMFVMIPHWGICPALLPSSSRIAAYAVAGGPPVVGVGIAAFYFIKKEIPSWLCFDIVISGMDYASDVLFVLTESFASCFLRLAATCGLIGSSVVYVFYFHVLTSPPPPFLTRVAQRVRSRWYTIIFPNNSSFDKLVANAVAPLFVPVIVLGWFLAGCALHALRMLLIPRVHDIWSGKAYERKHDERAIGQRTCWSPTEQPATSKQSANKKEAVPGVPTSNGNSTTTETTTNGHGGDIVDSWHKFVVAELLLEDVPLLAINVINLIFHEESTGVGVAAAVFSSFMLVRLGYKYAYSYFSEGDFPDYGLPSEKDAVEAMTTNVGAEVAAKAGVTEAVEEQGAGVLAAVAALAEKV